VQREWSPYPRGYPVAPTPSLGLGITEAVPRVALEVVFLVAVAVTVAVANFSALEIVLVMLLAFSIVALAEWVATRDRRPIARAALAPVGGAVEVQVEGAREVEVQVEGARGVEVQVEEGREVEQEESLGWAAFAEPSGPEALTVMGAISDTEDAPVSEVFARARPVPGARGGSKLRGLGGF